MQIGNHPLDKAYAESIKPIRNRMRVYDYDSLLDALLRRLNEPLTDHKVNNLQRLPWVVERLILWLLADNPLQYKKTTVDKQALDFLVHMAWDSVNKLYKQHIKIHSVKLFVRQQFLSQIPYQISLDSHSLTLQLYLISKLDEKSKLRKYLDIRAGMPIEQYFQMALLFWAHTNTERPWFNIDYIKSVLPIFPETSLNIFLNSITFRKHELHKLLCQRTIELDEWFQPVVLYKTPCVLHENTIIPFGRPTLRRYFENLVGDWLEYENGQCLQDYDRLISEYVEFGLQRCNANFLNEDGIKKLTNTKKRVCDFFNR